MRWILWSGVGLACLLALWVGAFCAVWAVEGPGAIMPGKAMPFSPCLRDWSYDRQVQRMWFNPIWWPLNWCWLHVRFP